MWSYPELAALRAMGSGKCLFRQDLVAAVLSADKVLTNDVALIAKSTSAMAPIRREALWSREQLSSGSLLPTYQV